MERGATRGHPAPPERRARCDLILDEHEESRRRFTEMDTLHADASEPSRLELLCLPLAQKLGLHASAEEAVFYPSLLNEGRRGEGETSDAIDDHNQIRDAIRRPESEAVGTDDWWDAILAARAANSDHMAEEEREAIPDFRSNAPSPEREERGPAWIDHQHDHAGGRGVDTADRDTDTCMSRHRAG
jgi:hypothetical protein